MMFGGCIGLTAVLCFAIFFFLQMRKKLYQRAEKIIDSYINNDYSCHLPQDSEGDIYYLFAAVEQLATMLQAKNETDHKTKEFLKNTISDISHQLKTPLAALMMYQEIIETEPDNADTVREFSKKIGTALKTRAAYENKQIIVKGTPNQTIICDMGWTSEAIGNLVKNALDHTEPGGIIRITWECTPTSGSINCYCSVYFSFSGSRTSKAIAENVYC